MQTSEKTMADLNQQMAEIFSNNSDNKPVIIQQLFNLLPLHQNDQKKVIQTAILYSMQNIHEWENIIIYTEKWQMDDFRHAVIDRMRLRLQENHSSSPIQNQQEQLRRLVQKYWRTFSPKKEENRYKEPINIKGLFNNKNSRKSEAFPSFKNAGRFSSFQNLQINNQPLTEQSNSLSNKVKSEQDNSLNRKRADPYSSLTGRPAILKKTSFFDQRHQKQLAQQKDKNIQNQKTNNKKQQQKPTNQQQGFTRTQSSDNFIENKIKNSNNQLKQTFKSNEQVVQKTNRKSLNIISERKSQQLQDNSPNFNEVESQSLKSINEHFPSIQQQFNFGSIKKTKDASLKHLTISPNHKMQVGPKILKINKPVDQSKFERSSMTKSQRMDISFGDDTDFFQKEKQSQFTFVPSIKKIEPIPQVKENKANKLSQKVTQKQMTITKSKQNQIKIDLSNKKRENNQFSQISFEDFKKDKYTPFFNNDQEFLNKDTLRYIDKVGGSSLSHSDLLKKMGMNIFSIFDRMLAAQR